MKSFRLYNSDLKKIKNLKKIGFFKIFKKPIILTILISTLIGLVAGSLGGVYMYIYLESLSSKDNFSERQDMFLEDQLDQMKNKSIKSIPDVVKESSPAVVSVIVSKLVPIIEQEFFNPFGENSPFNIRIPILRKKGEELKEIGGGTGFIVSPDGLIVTNKHVVLDEKAEYTVLMNDGTIHQVKILDKDPIQDVAILKIEASNLPTLKLGNSNRVEIGQTVIAIGNALAQFRNTVSVGVVSGLLRNITASGGGLTEELEELIQTDAAINKGNSGGPLINLYGEVIGVNAAVATGAENIGFAIPVNKVKKAITDVKTRGRIAYPFLGIRYIPIDKNIIEEKNLSVDYGVLIIRGENAQDIAIVPGSGAEKAGLQENDIILEINGRKINEISSLDELILNYYPGDEVILKVLRNEDIIIIKAVLGERE